MSALIDASEAAQHLLNDPCCEKEWQTRKKRLAATLARFDFEATHASEHVIEAIFNTDGADWKAICSCGWECWDHQSESEARRLHKRHADG